MIDLSDEMDKLKSELSEACVDVSLDGEADRRRAEHEAERGRQDSHNHPFEDLHVSKGSKLDEAPAKSAGEVAHEG